MSLNAISFIGDIFCRYFYCCFCAHCCVIQTDYENHFWDFNKVGAFGVLVCYISHMLLIWLIPACMYMK